MLRAEVEAIAAAARAADVTIVAGDTKVVERGHGRRDVHLHDRRRARSTRARALSPAALRPGDRILVSAPIGDHGTAIMLARGEFELGAHDRVRHAAAVAGRRRAARRARAPACAACATRRAAASPPSSTSWRAPRAWRCSCARPRCRCPDGGRRGGDPRASTRCTSPTRACSWPLSPPEHAEAALAALRAAARRRAGGGDRRGEDASRPGWCSWRRRSAASGSWTSSWATRCRGSVERSSDGGNGVRTQPGRRRRRSPPTSCGSRSGSPARATRWP